jgi:DNA gyrase subunit B
MNPGQLWDTTLDPDNRTLLEVRLDDPDDPEVGLVFAELMGDEVAPRRQFIEENALNVLNIDV